MSASQTGGGSSLESSGRHEYASRGAGGGRRGHESGREVDRERILTCYELDWGPGVVPGLSNDLALPLRVVHATVVPREGEGALASRAETQLEKSFGSVAFGYPHPPMIPACQTVLESAPGYFLQYLLPCNSRSTTQTHYEISLLHSKVIGEQSMDLPELAEDGCNWQTYGSWVLKAISEDGLMGHLDGSETRPTTPKLLQEYGAGWTPRTNEERDVITAWKTADNAWHQQAAMAHQFIIYGLPDSILMLCMHLDTPCEMFTYLENRYGQIPRPEIQKTVDEAVQQHDMPSEQHMTGESAQSTCNSDNEPENSPGGHEDSVDSLNDCAETKSGYLTPETKVIDMRHEETHLLEVEDRAADLKQPDEGMDTVDAPDKDSQCADDKVKDRQELPTTSSEALETQGDLPFTTSECAETWTGHRKPKNEVVDTRQVVDVLPMFEVGSTNRTWHGKHVKEHEAPDEGSQRASDKVAEHRDLPEGSTETLEPADDISGQAGGRSMQDVPQVPSEDDQRARMNSETIVNVPDPPWTHTKLPMPHIKSSTLQNRPLAREKQQATKDDASWTW
ncbi:hypothetical protein EDD16DRAFT_1762713 [Pisolithus croceorrhizus]|nr:hypothetical protein EDD16DRAFT_1762713 [Pisolithus croceorrhizus]